MCVCVCVCVCVCLCVFVCVCVHAWVWTRVHAQACMWVCMSPLQKLFMWHFCSLLWVLMNDTVNDQITLIHSDLFVLATASHWVSWQVIKTTVREGFARRPSGNHVWWYEECCWRSCSLAVTEQASAVILPQESCNHHSLNLTANASFIPERL